MEQSILRAPLWIGLALVIFGLCLQVWAYISARRSGRRQPMATNGVLASLGAVVVISGSLVGELAGPIMVICGCSLTWFAVGRMSATMNCGVNTGVRPRSDGSDTVPDSAGDNVVADAG